MSVRRAFRAVPLNSSSQADRGEDLFHGGVRIEGAIGHAGDQLFHAPVPVISYGALQPLEKTVDCYVAVLT